MIFSVFVSTGMNSFQITPYYRIRSVLSPEMCMEKVVTKPSVSHLTALTSWIICPFCNVSESATLAILFRCWFTWFDWLTSLENVAFVCCDFVFRVFGIPLPSLMQAPNLQQKQRTMRCSCGIE